MKTLELLLAAGWLILILIALWIFVPKFLIALGIVVGGIAIAQTTLWAVATLKEGRQSR